MAADRHEPAGVKEKLMMMIGAAATPLCNERLGADEGSIACVAAEGGLSAIRQHGAETEPNKEHMPGVWSSNGHDTHKVKPRRN